MPLSTTFQKAKELGIPYRKYKAEKGESWCDVMERGKTFLSEVVNSYVFPKAAGPKAAEEVKELAKEIKEKLSISGKNPKAAKTYPKVLAVTHGGFIMEFLNIYRELKGMGVSEKNIAKNTSIYAFRIECSNCKGVCKGGSCKGRNISMKILMENDNTHVTTK